MRQAYAHDALLTRPPGADDRAPGGHARRLLKSRSGRADLAAQPAAPEPGRQSMTTYTPGQAAEKTGFSLDTLRYYERIGLLSVARTAGGQRQYGEDDLGWLEILRCLRDTGMPIARMREYAELSRDDDTVADRIALLEEHDREVEERIATLQAQREHIRGKVAYYRSLSELTESAAAQ